MARTPYGFEVVREGTRLRALRTGLLDPRFVLTGVGALIVAGSQRAFREEKLGNVRWKTREETGMVPNWPGILADFAAGKTTPPNRRLGAQGTLTDTGRLRASINFRVTGQDTVEVGSNLPYASALHRGDETKTVPITKGVQDRLRAWIEKTVGASRRATKRAGKASRSERAAAEAKRDQKAKKANAVLSLRWLLNENLRGEKLTVSHPARPLVGLPKETREEIAKTYGQRVRSA